MHQPETDRAWMVTGIGSLLHQERSFGLADSLRWTPGFAFIPQLAQVELFDSINLQPFPRLPQGIDYRQGLLEGNPETRGALCELFSERPGLDILPGFKTAIAAGELGSFSKFQWVGPLTLATSIRLNGKAILEDPALFKLLADYLVSQISAVARWCRAHEINCLILDEPCLPVVEHLDDHTAARLLGALEQALDAIVSEGVVGGVHCCAKLDRVRIDWLNLHGACLSLDVSGDAAYLNAVLGSFREFYSSGRLLLLGCVPTQGAPTKPLSGGLIARQILQALGHLGWDKDEAQARVALTPACGLAGVSLAEAEAIFRLLHEISFKLAMP